MSRRTENNPPFGVNFNRDVALDLKDIYGDKEIIKGNITPGTSSYQLTILQNTGNYDLELVDNGTGAWGIGSIPFNGTEDEVYFQVNNGGGNTPLIVTSALSFRPGSFALNIYTYDTDGLSSEDSVAPISFTIEMYSSIISRESYTGGNGGGGGGGNR